MEDKIFLTKEQALKIADIENNQIHNFISVSFGLIGADYDIDTFKNYLETADSIEVGGEGCRGMGHAIALIKNKEIYFFKHNEKALLNLLQILNEGKEE